MRKSTKSFTLADLQAAPKLELHCHLDGSFPLDLLFETANKYPDTLPDYVTSPVDGSKMPVKAPLLACKTAADMAPLVTSANRLGLPQMLAAFDMFLPIVADKMDVLEKAAKMFVKRKADNNVIYTEARYSPHVMLHPAPECPEPKHTAEDVVKAVTRGLQAGVKEYGIVVKQILCCLNLSPQWSAEVADLCIKYKDADDAPPETCGVVGIDIASGEQHFDDPTIFALHKAALDKARTHGLGVTVHAGEGTSPASHVATAISPTGYHASRIGHGYAACNCPSLLDTLRSESILLEICPTSSVCTQSHTSKVLKQRVNMLLERKNPIAPSTDDPAVFEINLDGEFERVASMITYKNQDGEPKMKPTDLISKDAHFNFVFMMTSALDLAFCSDVTRAAVRSRLLSSPFYDDGSTKKTTPGGEKTTSWPPETTTTLDHAVQVELGQSGRPVSEGRRRYGWLKIAALGMLLVGLCLLAHGPPADAPTMPDLDLDRVYQIAKSILRNGNV